MNISFLQQLRCPFCSGRFKTAVTDQISGEPGYNVLTCYCSRYPVVAGIPILKKDNTIDKVIALTEAGRHLEALLTMVSPTSFSMSPLWKLSSLLPYKATFLLKGLVQERALKKWQERATVLLTDQSGQDMARDLIDFFIEYGNDYFFFRFGQPRYLVALSLVSLINQPMKPILDLACGCGHITRSLVHRAKDQQVIGVDQSFIWLFIAKYWIAPEAEYVCCNADISLPFQDDAFSTVFCSDAFHYFGNKATNIRELKRLTRDKGVIELAWVNNAFFRRPYNGLPLPLEGYQMLINDMPHRLLADCDILARYLQKQGPPLAHSADIEHLNQQRTFSIVVSHNQEIFKDYGFFDDWPHAQGQLRLNPHYVEEGRDEFEKVNFLRTFPSAWYEKEHAECKEYLPEKIEVQSKILTDLYHGKRTPEVERLIKQCVVLGMPIRYY